MDGPLGELGESKVLGALVEIKFLGAFGSGLGFKCFESCLFPNFIPGRASGVVSDDSFTVNQAISSLELSTFQIILSFFIGHLSTLFYTALQFRTG